MTTDDIRKTVGLSGSDKLEESPVYGADDEKIGQVERVVIDMICRKAAFAALSFDGFMGFYPVPWSMLRYDTRPGGDKRADQVRARMEGEAARRA